MIEMEGLRDGGIGLDHGSHVATFSYWFSNTKSSQGQNCPKWSQIMCACVCMDVWPLTRVWHESSTSAECYMFSPPTDRAADRRDDFSRSSDESLSMILRHILAVSTQASFFFLSISSPCLNVISVPQTATEIIKMNSFKNKQSSVFHFFGLTGALPQFYTISWTLQWWKRIAVSVCCHQWSRNCTFYPWCTFKHYQGYIIVEQWFVLLVQYSQEWFDEFSIRLLDIS